MKEIVNVLARDGYELSATWFIAENPNGKVLLINSATGVKQEFYSDLAAHLAKQGINVYTFDYRGIGASRPARLKNVLCDMKDWAKDVDAMIGYITRLHSASQLVILGHSIGGQLIGMSNLSRHADALIMVGAQTPYWKNYEGAWMKLKLYAFWNLMIPVLTKLYGYFPAKQLGMFENLPRRVARQWARWARNPNYVFDETPMLLDSFGRLDQQTLMISFSDDELAPHRAVLDLKRFYTRLKIDHRHYFPEEIFQIKVGHFGLFKKRNEATLWREIERWIEKVTPSRNNRAA